MEEVTGGALEEDHILCPAACTCHPRCKGSDVNAMGLLHPSPTPNSPCSSSQET